MNAPLQPVRWNWRRWAWIVAGGLLVHAALVFWLGESDPDPAPPAGPKPWLRMAVDPASIRSVAEAPALTDPTLFALPSYHGFSGEAWVKYSPAEPPKSEWSEPPQWLSLDADDLGEFFSRFVATNQHSGFVLADLLKPPATTADILLLYDSQTTQSVARLEGSLSERSLLAPIQAPSPAYADVLPDTVVYLGVNQDGQTESAILLAGCGVKSVDEQALLTAKSARFRPVWPGNPRRPGAPKSDLTWAKLVFQWYTVPLSATNATALNLP